MAKKKSAAKKAVAKKTTAKKTTTKNRILPSKPATAEVATPGGGLYALRETIESIVIAFVLAFLFRTFEAEAFVIPTGSMSPALQGQHKDVDCSECGYRFRTTASEEGSDRRLMEFAGLKQIQQRVQFLRSQLKQARSPMRQQDIQADLRAMQQREESQKAVVASFDTVIGTCPMCRQTMAMRPDLPSGVPPHINLEGVEHETSYPGDRILVNKYAYNHRDPERWDVIVFKFPGNGEMNYIKRLVGLPNETLQVFQGDIFIRDDVEKGAKKENFQIERKPAEKVLAMLQAVHDTDYDPNLLFDAGWPLRWEPTTPDGWQIEAKAGQQAVEQRFQIEAKGAAKDGPIAWLRYRNFVPQPGDWLVARNFKEKGKFSGISQEQWLSEAKTELIRDFNPYNAMRQRGQIQKGGWDMPDDRYHMHWVGDLAVECEVEVEQAEGELTLDLVEAGQHFTCRIDLETGQATVGVAGFEALSAAAKTSVSSTGTYRLRFANVDDQLLLWVDGDLISLSAANPAFSYDADKVFGGRENALPVTSDTDLGDLAPAGIGARGATLTVNRLQVLRDIYYVATNWKRTQIQQICDYPHPKSAIRLEDGQQLPALTSVRQQFTDPENWEPRFSRRRKEDFKIESGQLFVMGDNSPASSDCRLWASANPSDSRPRPGGPYLDRRLLIGKAVCVFWPHSWGSIPGASMLPGFPGFGDMRLVR